MTNFLLALQFLTTIPVKIKHVDEKKISASLNYFPLIGALLGLTLTGVDNILSFLNFKALPANIILIILLIVLTGGIHLDGLADTIDAFLSRKDKDEMLRIMRDSHIGVMGVLAIISILLLKIAFLSSIDVLSKGASLVLMCTLSRWSLVLAMFLFPYARQEGKAKAFIQGINFKIFTFVTLIALGCVVIVWKIKGLFIIVVVGMSSYIISRFISDRMGGLTGDTLGAIDELIEVIVLFSICILEQL